MEISCRTGEGLEKLKKELLKRVAKLPRAEKKYRQLRLPEPKFVHCHMSPEHRPLLMRANRLLGAVWSSTTS